MSSRIFQSVIIQMKDATDRQLGVMTVDGAVVASSELSLIGTMLADIVFVEGKDQITIKDGRTFKLLSGWNGQYDYVVFVQGEDALARTLCIMAGIAMSEAKTHYEEKYDKGTFIRNIISDNILPGDIYVRAKELHFPMDVPRAVFLIRQQDKSDIAVAQYLQTMFPDREHDFVISVTDADIVLIKETVEEVEGQELLKMAAAIQEAIGSELSIKTVIGVGSVARQVKELADRYKEAQVAIEVGKVFETEKTIIHYENLGIGRLIYQLPTTLCEMFLSEVFKKSPIDALDQETLYTINKFFENNLNVSETSRKLFVHRNTLVYRLEKIKKLTGLDLREFDHAIVFKVALMVKKYLSQGKDAFL